ncbi:MAG: AAA family ATPase [Thermoguttaceae bacterium]|nr:AAA family ATPase [Thermoguttaceae bacterium]
MTSFDDASIEENIIFRSYDEFVDASAEALDAEISASKNEKNKKYIHLSNGRKIIDGLSDANFTYIFENDDETPLLPDAPILLSKDDQKCRGYVAFCEENAIGLRVDADWGDVVETAEVSVDLTVLLEGLRDRLRTTTNAPSAILKTLILDGRKAIRSGELAKGQEAACEMARVQPITFIWGPPGTGKTTTLAKIATDFVLEGKRVLVASHSNAAVDEAALRTIENLRKTAAGKERLATRYGYPRKREILEADDVASFKLALNGSPKLKRERENLLDERKELQDERKTLFARAGTSENARKRIDAIDVRRKEIGERLKKIREELSYKEKTIARKAAFLATTASKLAVDDIFNDELRFDVVIFDEASMAFAPQVALAASLATKRFICLGDFQQLPPISISQGALLKTDVFRLCGVVDAIESARRHDWLALLNVQYRMHPDIAETLNETMYAGALETSVEIVGARRTMAKIAPFERRALGVVDLTGTSAYCLKTNENSRFNPLSALVACATAATLEKESGGTRSVGIVAPYRAQARLIRAILKDWETVEKKRKEGTRRDKETREERNEGAEIRCATAHQFQGGECDYIVYDATECYVQTSCGRLLTEKKGNFANRLFNVAASRARGKLVAVGHVGFLKRKIANKLVFKRFLTKICEKKEFGGQNEQAFQTLKANATSDAFGFWSGASQGKEAEKLYFNDLKNAKESVWIDWRTPTSAWANETTLLEILQTLNRRGVKLHLYSNEPEKTPEAFRGEVAERRNALNSLTVVDGKVVWVGAPFADNLFRSKDGKQLEALTRPIVARILGEKTAGALKALLNVDFKKKVREKRRRETNLKIEGQRSFADYVAENVVCSKCGKTMRLRKSRRGFFFGCSGYSGPSKCDGMKNVDFAMVAAYLGTTERFACGDWVSDFDLLDGKYGLYLQRRRDGKKLSLDNI